MAASLFPSSSIFAQGTAFTYQGQLAAGGQQANGSFDMAFSLYNAAANGTQVGAAVTNFATGLSNGLFTVGLDFGPMPYNGRALWLQIAVSPAGSNTFTTLSPLQPLTSIPYAVQSLNATTASNVTGSIALQQLPNTVLTNGETNVSVAGTISGNGSGLVDVSLQPVSVASTSVQAAANTSYVATNANLTVISLPANANVGDIIQILGTGAGGWEAAGNINGATLGAWTQTSAPSEQWTSVASSSDGTYLVAAIDNGRIYTSTNSGGAWVLTSAPSEGWSAVASSSDGTHLVAVAAQIGIYTSTNSGGTWVLTSASPSANWLSVASSSDGTHLVAVVIGGGIYTSTNSGTTWTPTSAPAENWYSVASSFDGTHLAAAAQSGGIYTSTNSGGTWVLTSAPSTNWSSVASSSDGTHLVAAINNNYPPAGIYTSTNSGGTWVLTSAPDEFWLSVACSSDGTHLVAGENGGIYTSADSGGTWVPAGVPSKFWISVASSSDGTHLVATMDNGGIYAEELGPTQAPGTSQEFQYVGNGVWQTVSPPLPSPVAFLTSNQTFTGTVAFSQPVSVTNTVYASGLSLYESGLETSFSIRNSTSLLAELAVETSGNNVLLRASNTSQQLILQTGAGNADIILGIGTTTVQGTFNNNSDRNAKENFASVSPAEILDKVARLPLSKWSYKVDAGTRHIGPMAQDFYSAFNVGTDDRHIAPIDEGGVTLAAIQGVNQKLEAEVKALKVRKRELQNRLNELERLVKVELENH